MLRKHVYNENLIVIGSSLKALEYAFNNDALFILNKPFDSFDHSIDSNVMMIFLSMQGKMPFCEQPLTIYVLTRSSRLMVRTERNQIKMVYNNLIIFDTDNVVGVPFIEKQISKYEVYDFWKSDQIVKMTEPITDNRNNFCKKVFLSDSQIVSLSFFSNRETIKDIEFSPSISRLKTLKMLNKPNIDISWDKRIIREISNLNIIEHKNVRSLN